jgi:ubiquinone/menaquinone biosynthesis C-methylase UbiE
MAKHEETIRREFAKQAAAFGNKNLTLSNEDLLSWMLAALPLEPASRVLDVAAGTGLLGRAMAPHVCEVVAIDATSEMLAEGRAEAEGAALSNITFEQGMAEELPYDDGSFDLVACRLAIHHFEDPRPPLAEMARVCRPGGDVGVIDLVFVGENSISDRYNEWERLRDPSHTRALPEGELIALFEDGSLTVSHVDRREVELYVERWLGLSQTPQETGDRIKAALRRELDGGEATGLRPFVRGDELMFRHTWAVVIGRKDT